MANTNAPFGLLPYKHPSGKERLSEYTIATGYTSNICRGDPVELTGTGKNIQLAAAANADNLGVFAGCRYVNAAGEQKNSPYWPASTTATDIVALVWDDPEIIYQIEGDTVNEADIGLLADWNAGTASTTYGRSGAYAVVSAGATTNQALRLLGLVPRVGNAYGAYAKVLVKFSEHALSNAVAGVGGVS